MNYAGTKPECLTAVALVNKTLGYPLKGVHFGGGIHAPMPEAWDGKGLPAAGWTVAHVETDVIEATKDWTVALTDQFTADKIASSTLTPPEKTQATAILSKTTTPAAPAGVK